MKQHLRHFVLALVICFISRQPAKGQIGNDNPTSVSGEYSGSITTAGSYDPYTGNAKRVIEDMAVTGSIGAYPLKWARILNTRGGGSGWTHSYNWGLWIRPPQPPHGGENQYEGPVGGVTYPDGRYIELWNDPEIGNEGPEWDIWDAEGPAGMINKIIDRGAAITTCSWVMAAKSSFGRLSRMSSATHSSLTPSSILMGKLLPWIMTDRAS